MIDIELNPQGDVVLNVDQVQFTTNPSSIKSFIGGAGELRNHPQNTPGTSVQTIIVSASNPITQEAFDRIRKKLSVDFVDYKNRALIASETRDLRNILYAKAFANSDDFVEFEFKD